MSGSANPVQLSWFGYKIKDGLRISFFSKSSDTGQHLVSILPDERYFFGVPFRIINMFFNALYLDFQNLTVLFIHLILILCPQILENSIINDGDDSTWEVEQKWKSRVLCVMDRIECKRHHKEEKGDRDQCENSKAPGVHPGYIRKSSSQNKKFQDNRSKIGRQKKYCIWQQRAFKQCVEQCYTDQKVVRAGAETGIWRHALRRWCLQSYRSWSHPAEK